MDTSGTVTAATEKEGDGWNGKKIQAKTSEGEKVDLTGPRQVKVVIVVPRIINRLG